MHRRDFIHPRQLAKTAGQVLDLGGELVSAPRPASPDAICLRFSRRAMATSFEIILPFGTPPGPAEAALDLIDTLESQLTIYRDESEISRLNREAAVRPFPVEAGLFELLWQCQQLFHDTGGAFDVAVGPLIKTWGFHRRQGRIPPEAERAKARDRCGWRHIVLDPERKTAAFTQPGVEINLGSIGKGHALDRVVRLLRRDFNVRDALVHGGHSSVFAMGHEPGSTSGWPVGLLHPERSGQRLGVFHLLHRGLGTSAITNQHFVHEGRKLGHLLDPRAGWPAEGMLSASATAPTAAEADGLATAFFIQGIPWTRAYCQKRPEIGAVLLPAQGPLTILGKAGEEFRSGWVDHF